MDFDSLVDDSAQATAQGKPVQLASNAPASGSFDNLVDDSEKYGSSKQQVMAGMEGAAQGVLGPLAPAIEKSLGIDPNEIRLRAENNPWTHRLTEAGGFVGGMLTGTGEAALVGKAGEGVTAAMKLGGEGASIASRLAAGAARGAAEMTLIQAGDEATKAITEDPNQTIGTAAINVGLSGLLGGALGGAFTGMGMAAKAGILASGLDTALNEFTDRVAYRGANLNANESIQNELKQAVDAYHEMGSEVGGASGIKAQALAKIMPEMGEKITGQSQELAEKMQAAIEKLGDDPNAKYFQDALDTFKNKISQSSGEMEYTAYGEPRPKPATSAEVFEATQVLKKQLHEWGEFSRISTPPIADRSFISAAKSLGHEFKTALEDQAIWGQVAELQNKLNHAWSEAIPSVKDIESKFMTKVAGDRTIDPAKFNTYVNQNGKSTSSTIRQQMMGKFLDAIEKFHAATDLAYQKAGLANPHPPLGLTALKESLEKKSPWAKLADLYYDRALSSAAGTTIGAAVGGGVGHATGIPGAGWAASMLGGKLGEKILPGIIQPIMTKSLNSGALQQAVKFSESVLKGNAQLIKTTKNIFAGAAETFPQHFLPTEASREKLNKGLEYASANPSQMFNVGGDLGHYMPNHQTALAQHAQSAVSYLNSLRPKNPQMSPLDTKIPPSKDQVAQFNRQLDIAEQPLLVMHHIKQSTLLPQDIATLKTVYPALYPKMVQELTSALTNHLSKGEGVPYRLRQSLSQFIGQPLDSTMTPGSIVSIQSVFLPKQAPQAEGQPQTGKKSTQKLSKIAVDTQTQSQAREERAHKI